MKGSPRQTNLGYDNHKSTVPLEAEIIFQRLNDAGQSYSVFAACVFEGAENERAAAVVLHVVRQVLSGDVGCAALVWALDRKARAVVLVVL